MDYKRADRVKELIQEEVSMIIQTQLKDPRVGFVTITGVKLSDDLRHARVMVSIYGDEEVKKQTMAGLQSAAGFIRRQISKLVHLRYIPEIVFESDRSLEYGARIDEVLASWGNRDTENETK